MNRILARVICFVALMTPVLAQEPRTWTTAEDHQQMMTQLGISRLRPGPSGNDKAPNQANYDESKANPFPILPDALTLKSGAKVASPAVWWKQRRPEIVEDFEREVVGRIPRGVPAVQWSVVSLARGTLGGRAAIGRQLVGRVTSAVHPALNVNIQMTLVTPAEASGPVPVMIMFGGGVLPQALGGPAPARRGGGPPAAPVAGDPPATEQLIAAGWGFVSLSPSSIQADNGAGLTRGIIGLVNKGQSRKPDDWGALRAWAWGASRALDYLETDPAIDARRVGIEGVSRYGKAALVTMAFDQRFAVVLVGSSGEGGAKLHRRNWGEQVENLTAPNEYHWMAGNFLKYGAAEAGFGSRNAGDIPVDAHQLMALCAPRATFISYGVPERGDARWLDHQGSYMAAVAAGPVFRLLGARDLGTTDDYRSEKMPAVNVSMLDGHLAWRQHDGGHTDGPNWKYFIPWADRVLGRALPVTSLVAQQPPPGGPGGGRGGGGRGGGRGQAPPRYEMTVQDRQAIQAKLDELDPLVRALKAKRGEDDLMADVEIHGKGARWMLEFPTDVTVQDDVAFALKMIDRGIERARQLQSGQSPWTSQKGKVALGFYSPLDGSVQPLLLTIPAGYDGRPTRLDIVLHGRSQRLIESNWICYSAVARGTQASFGETRRSLGEGGDPNAQTGERLLTHAAGSCLQPTPNPSATGAWNAGQFQLEVFARGNNANHWAGEVDVFESTAAVQRRFTIDDSKLVLRGFSLGGAGAWHLALHHPDRWVAAEIGAGTWPRRYLMMDQFPPHQRPTLRIWENMTEWALNAFNIPIAGHDGDSDTQVASIPRPPEGEPTRGQLESSIRIREQLAKEGYPYEGEPTSYVAKGTPSIFLISENTGHSTSPKVRQRLDAFLKEWTDRGLTSPDRVRFLTYTTRYNKSFWVTIDGLGKHYERAEVDAQRLSGGTSYQIKTANVSRLVLRETDKATEIRIDGQTLRVKPVRLRADGATAGQARELALEKSAAGWRAAPAKRAGLHKTHGLQGPIDDAFLDPFLLVRPTGAPWNQAAHQLAVKRLERFDQTYARFYRAHPRVKNDTDVTEADFAKYNVVLFGDPGSNRWIGRLVGRLPVKWSRETVTVGDRSFPAANHLPALVYPNPIAASKYVVLNSGLTIVENSYTSDYSMPTLGDIAVLQAQPEPENFTVPFAGFFDESWQLNRRVGE